MDDSKIAVVYFGDETDFRKKKCGLDLIEQLYLSVNSLRNNWSKTVEVYFFHTRSLSEITLNNLRELNVQVLQSESVIEPEFPLSNKILVGDLYKANKDILFLDCDTVIHKPVNLETDSEMLVAYDAMKNIEVQDYNKVSNFLQLDFADIELYDSPAFEYYFHDKKKQFPVFNSGVFFLKKQLQKDFYLEYKRTFSDLYAKFKMDKWKFYIEQIAFSMAIVKLKINYSIFPKGYNFICTPRADFLKSWDKSKIIIEHYAGDNGSPISFNQIL